MVSLGQLKIRFFCEQEQSSNDLHCSLDSSEGSCVGLSASRGGGPRRTQSFGDLSELAQSKPSPESKQSAPQPKGKGISLYQLIRQQKCMQAQSKAHNKGTRSPSSWNQEKRTVKSVMAMRNPAINYPGGAQSAARYTEKVNMKYLLMNNLPLNPGMHIPRHAYLYQPIESLDLQTQQILIPEYLAKARKST